MEKKGRGANRKRKGAINKLNNNRDGLIFKKPLKRKVEEVATGKGRGGRDTTNGGSGSWRRAAPVNKKSFIRSKMKLF